MKNLNFKKEFVLATLKANRTKHDLIFQEAMAKYKDKALMELNLTLEKIRKGVKFKLWFELHEPVQHLKEYDLAISMLENSTESDYVELNQEEYAQLIQDDWKWQHNFLTLNSSYSDTAAARLSGQ